LGQWMTARFKVAIQIRLRQLPGTGCNGALLVGERQKVGGRAIRVVWRDG